MKIDHITEVNNVQKNVQMKNVIIVKLTQHTYYMIIYVNFDVQKDIQLMKVEQNVQNILKEMINV